MFNLLRYKRSVKYNYTKITFENSVHGQKSNKLVTGCMVDKFQQTLPYTQLYVLAHYLLAGLRFYFTQLACYSFTDARIRQETLGSERKAFISHSPACR
jgi:hypothetical protein